MERLSMRKVKEILGLEDMGWDLREIARSVATSHSTASDTVNRARAAKASWPLPAGMDEATLEAMLYPGQLGRPRRWAEPDMEWVHRELAA